MIQRFARICKNLLQTHIQGLDLRRESFEPELGVIFVRQVQDLVFGYGSTKCLGKAISAINMNKVLVEVCLIPIRIVRWPMLTVRFVVGPQL